MTFSGYSIGIEVKDDIVSEQFVIPALLTQAIASMVGTFMETDPHDEFSVRVQWTSRSTKPIWSEGGIRAVRTAPSNQE